MLNTLDISELSEWLLQLVDEEIYIVEPQSLRIRLASNKALQRKQCSMEEVSGYTFDRLLDPPSKALLQEFLASHQVQSDFAHESACLPTDKHKPQSKAGEYRYSLLRMRDAEMLGAISGKSQPSASVQNDNELHYQAIASNIPGLIYQLRLDGDHQISFPYLSEGCESLLDVKPKVLQSNPALFIEKIIPEDRYSFLSNLLASAKELKPFNWEGRIKSSKFQDIKWINLRSSPRKLAEDVLQWDGIMYNITQSKREKLEIKNSHRRLAELSIQLEKIKEQERIRIAREIHDGLGGNLTAIKIVLGSVIKKMRQSHQPGNILEKIQQLEAIVDRTFNAVHKISSDLRPDVLEFGIVEALNWQSKEFEKQIGISCNFRTNDSQKRLSADQDITLFRICQEGLSNIAKHSQATEVDIELMFEQSEVMMRICDNGVGIVPDNLLKPNSYGLRGMAERVAALKGSFEIKRGNSGGTIKTIKLPLG